MLLLREENKDYQTHVQIVPSTDATLIAAAPDLLALAKEQRDEIARLRAELAAVRAAENEACAKIADEWATNEQRQYGNGGPAAAIRARMEAKQPSGDKTIFHHPV